MSGKRDIIRAFGYVARPKRKELRDGIEQSYWTVRSRRKGSEGEWRLGWFASTRAAESAFNDWVAKHRERPAAPAGQAAMLDVLTAYCTAVETMTALRPNTLSNRLYTASQLRLFVEQAGPIKIGEFDDAMFARYKLWMEGEKYSSQTVLNGVVGARTFLRWAVSSGYCQTAPKPPHVHVPQVPREPLFEEDLKATIEAAKPPLNLLIALLAETGLRIAEATSMRRCDIQQNGKLWLVRIIPRGAFVPKTTHSTRSVPISPELAEVLLKLTDDPSGTLFACGTIYWYQHWRQLLIKAQKKAEVAPFTFHGLRRAVADRLRRTGTPLDVYIAMMGHAAITGLRHYSTVSLDDIRDAQVKALTGVRRRQKGGKGH